MSGLLKKSPPTTLQQAREQMASSGFAILKSAFSHEAIESVRLAASAFYDAAEHGRQSAFPRAYLYNPGNMAVSMAALDDYGTTDYRLLRIVADSQAATCIRHYLGDDAYCSLTHSRLRKSYSQHQSNHAKPSTVAWHCDGDPSVGYFNALILWVPFTPCNDEYPGLEIQSSDGRHFRPSLDPGDALLFDDKCLHRTADCPSSVFDRYSCDMRFFRASDIPDGVHQKVAQEPLLRLSAFSERA
jgi:ectoine hydroxylase-related dioxygenase (phytanoyl-CoA dioxygenase family)